MSRRLGLLGGTFDPPHYGHLVAAEQAAWELSLDRVVFIPARHPPHKQGEAMAGSEHRLAMVRLAIAGNPLFELSILELERPGLSYTVDTLRELRARERDVELFFIVGMDSLRDLPTWHDPSGILEQATVVAVSRAGWTPVDLRAIEATVPGATRRVQIVPIPGVDVSSRALRERVAAGQPIRYLVSDSVSAYIMKKRLYQIAR